MRPVYPSLVLCSNIDSILFQRCGMNTKGTGRMSTPSVLENEKGVASQAGFSPTCLVASTLILPSDAIATPHFLSHLKSVL